MSKNDNAIKDLLQKVEEQKKSLGTKERVSWITNGVFKKGGDFFNINTVNDPLVLVEALGFLIVQLEGFDKARFALGVSGDFKWDGYTYNDWQEDFKTRIKIIEYDKKKKVLDATKAKLNSLVSEEARTEMELDDIKKILNG